MIVSGRDAVHQVVDKVHAYASVQEAPLLTQTLVPETWPFKPPSKRQCVFLAVLQFMSKREQMEQDSLQPEKTP